MACRIHHTAYAYELDAFGLVELMGGTDETEVALIDEVG